MVLVSLLRRGAPCNHYSWSTYNQIMSEATQKNYEAPLPCGWGKNTIEGIAERFAVAINFKCDDEIEPVVSRLGGSIEYEDFPLENAMLAGWIEVEGTKDFRIRLNNDANSIRDRFTIAHELGHYVLHYLFALEKRGNFKLSANLIDGKRQGLDPDPENEANYFALALLMPKIAFTESYNANTSVVKHKNPLELVATKFGVPIWAVNARADSLELIK